MIKLKPLLRIANREIGLLLNSKSILLFTVLLPFVSILFFNSLLKVGVAHNLPIAVVDYDNSAFSRTIVAQLDATPEVAVNYFPESNKKGEELVRLGKVYGLVTIPSNFQSDLKSGKQVVISNQYNSNYFLGGGLENKAIRKVIGTISAGIFIEKQRKTGISNGQALINYQPIEVSYHTLSNPFTNYSYYLNTGFFTIFFQIFVMLSTIYCIGYDLKYNKGGKLLRVSNNSLATVILGKITPYTVWYFLVGIVILLSMYVWQDFPFAGNKFLVLSAMFLLIVSTQSIAVFFISVSNSFREALTFGSGFSAVSLSFSGITFPIFGMPEPMQYLSKIFPFTHFFELLLDQSQRGFPVYFSLKPLFALIVLCIIPVFFSYNKLRKLFFKGKFNNAI